MQTSKEAPQDFPGGRPPLARPNPRLQSTHPRSGGHAGQRQGRHKNEVSPPHSSSSPIAPTPTATPRNSRAWETASSARPSRAPGYRAPQVRTHLAGTPKVKIVSPKTRGGSPWRAPPAARSLLRAPRFGPALPGARSRSGALPIPRAPAAGPRAPPPVRAPGRACSCLRAPLGSFLGRALSGLDSPGALLALSPPARTPPWPFPGTFKEIGVPTALRPPGTQICLSRLSIELGGVLCLLPPSYILEISSRCYV